MSFENKGFKNDLNEAYFDLNQEALGYEETPSLTDSSIGNFNPVPLRTYQPFGTIGTIGAGAVKSVGNASEKSRIGTEENPTGYSEFIIKAPSKKKSKKKLYYIIGGAVLLLLILWYVRKKA